MSCRGAFLVQPRLGFGGPLSHLSPSPLKEHYRSFSRSLEEALVEYLNN